MFKFFQKGTSIYLALLVMTVLLAIALGLHAILISQIKMIKRMDYSVIALYAADTGIERALYEGIAVSGYLDLNDSGTQDEGDAIYDVEKLLAGEAGCPSSLAQDSCLKSMGIFKETRRRIEAIR